MVNGGEKDARFNFVGVYYFGETRVSGIVNGVIEYF